MNEDGDLILVKDFLDKAESTELLNYISNNNIIKQDYGYSYDPFNKNYTIIKAWESLNIFVNKLSTSPFYIELDLITVFQIDSKDKIEEYRDSFKKNLTDITYFLYFLKGNGKISFQNNKQKNKSVHIKLKSNNILFVKEKVKKDNIIIISGTGILLRGVCFVDEKTQLPEMSHYYSDEQDLNPFL